MLHKWCLHNKSLLNAKKCYVISFYRKRNPIHIDYYIDEDKITRVPVVTVLGILIDDKMTFSPHFDKIKSSGAKILGFIKRRAYEFSYVTKTLYCTFVRPIMEYDSVVWNPYELGDIAKIESRILLYALKGFRMENQYIKSTTYL